MKPDWRPTVRLPQALHERLMAVLRGWGWRRNGLVALILSRRVGMDLATLEEGWSLTRSIRGQAIEEPLVHLRAALSSPIRPDGVHHLAEAAHFLGVRRETLGIWVTRGYLPSTVSEGFTWFRGSDLLRMLARQSLGYLDAVSLMGELPREWGIGQEDQ